MADFAPRPPQASASERDSARDTSSAWAEAAQQLRGLREQHQRAWGNVDSSTLGRYLVDEVDATERARVEAEIAAHPELARLTDLVRDVLADFEPDEAEPTTTPAPLLALPESSAAPTPAPQAVAPAQDEPTVLPFAPRPSQVSFFRRFRHELTLLAAACVLFVLGGAILQFGASDPNQAGTSGPAVVSLLEKATPAPLTEDTIILASLKPVEQLRYAQTLESRGNTLKDQGHLAQAEQNLTQARTIRGEVYQLALNTPTEYDAWKRKGPRLLATPSVPPSSDPRVNIAVEPPMSAFASNATASRDQESRLRDLRYVRWKIVDQSPEKVRESVVPVFMQTLRNTTNAEQRLGTLRALDRLGCAARDATPLVLDRLKNAGTPEEKRAAVRTLGRIGAGMPGVPEILTEVIVREPSLSLEAGRALFAMGPSGRRAIASLQDQVQRKLEASRQADPMAEIVANLRQLDEEATLRTGILDVACVFTPQVLLAANQRLDEASVEPASQVFIETLPQLPTDGIAERARLVGPQGLHVLIAVESGQVQLHVGEALRTAGFTAQQERDLAQRLTHLVTARRYDEVPELILTVLPMKPE